MTWWTLILSLAASLAPPEGPNGDRDPVRGLKLARGWVAAAATVALAAWRRRRAVLLVAAGALLWVLIEVAFALHGFPAVPRYLFEPGAIVAVLFDDGAAPTMLYR